MSYSRFCIACNKLIAEGSYCDPCADHLTTTYCESRNVALVNKVFIKGYGSVSEKRIGEMRRRVILPREHDANGDYVVGRRGENGKIQDREPTY